MELADFNVFTTLPASGDCYGISVITQQRTRIPKAECDEKKKMSVILFYDDYRMLKFANLKNCQFNECKQIEGAFDQLFLGMDKALQKIPLK